MNGFEQIKSFYSWVFNNPDKVRPTHISLYIFLVNQNNRSMWVEWFKCPYDLAMQGAAINSKNTYYKTLKELQEFGLIEYEKGINDFKAPKIKIISISRVPKNDTLTGNVSVPLSEPLFDNLSDNLSAPHTEPLSVLLSKNTYKLITNNYKLINDNIHIWVSDFLKSNIGDKKNKIPTLDEFVNYAVEKEPLIDKNAVKLKYEAWVENGWKNGNGAVIKNWKSNLNNTIPYIAKTRNGYNSAQGNKLNNQEKIIL